MPEIVPEHDSLPVVVIGAGPIGLAAAAHLRSRGLNALVLEAGATAGAAVREWSHIRLFSPWSELVDPAAAKLLADSGWAEPSPGRYPTGGDWVDQYLAPLAEALGGDVRYGVRVTGVAKRGRDLLVDSGRESEPFTVHVDGVNGPERILARAVIDASGTWTGPNPLGGDGLPALGEQDAVGQISHRVPDFNDVATCRRYDGKHVVVAGTGASAKSALIALASRAKEEPATRVTWLVRRPGLDNAFGGGENDQLVERGVLGLKAQAAAGSEAVTTRTGFRAARVETETDGSLTIESFDGQIVEHVDEVIVLTGFRPDLTFLSEIRLDLDPVLQSPRQLAPLIDPNVHSCGTVYPHGAKELAQPETGLYMVGMKSYGRATSFLALTGFEQVRSVVAEIAGDHEAAANVELTLPDSGVCGGAGLFDEEAAQGDGCCGGGGASPTELLTIGGRGIQ